MRHKTAPAAALLALLLFAAAAIQCARPPDVAARPNFVVILVDDLGYRDVGFNGATEIRTPNIDRIAQEGVVFRNGYVTSPICTPSRAGLLTGRYPARFGLDANLAYAPNGQMREVVDVYGVLHARAPADGAVEFGAPPVVERAGYDGFDPPMRNPPHGANDERAHGGSENADGFVKPVSVGGRWSGHGTDGSPFNGE